MNALIVDPSRSYRRILSSALESNNFSTTEVSGVQDAEQLCQTTIFELICMAAELPDGDSYELAGRIRLDKSSNNGAAILLLTSNYSHEVLEKAFSLGITEVFRKKDFTNFEYYLSQFTHQLLQAGRQAGHILYVEDNLSVALVTRATLEESDHKVDHYTTGEEAEAAFLEQDYDLVLTDILLAGELSGTSLVRAIRHHEDESKRQVPVVAMSSFSDSARRMELFRCGINDYVQKPVLGEELTARVNNLMQTELLLKQLNSQQEKLRELALVDQLTGLYNRHFLMDTVPKRIAQALRHSDPLSMIMVDIDHFKLINDTLGHAVGDEVLAAVGGELNRSCRDEDIVSRYGGEEFVILLDRCDLVEATKKAEFIRKMVEKLKPAGRDITASFGVCSMRDTEGEGFASMFERADRAVYQAKDTGRNRVVAD